MSRRHSNSDAFPLADYLPFHLDDTEQVNRCFLQWSRSREHHLRVMVDVWSYCYASRYFAQKFSRENQYSITACEELTIAAYLRMMENIETVRQPDRYSSWASVICKRAFLNYIRSKKVVNTVDADELHDSSAELPEYTSDERRHIFRTISDAIDELPAHLRDIARLRFLYDQSYEEMGATLGKEVVNIRAYAHKALAQLRSNPSVDALVKEFLRNHE